MADGYDACLVDLSTRAYTGNIEPVDQRVHVWAVRLQAPDAVVAQFQRVLSPDERGRAARFCFDHLQRSFTLARGALRVLLGRYLDTPPGDIEFTYGPKGKPALAAPARLQFNASHSGGLALFAFTLDCALGVDVEHIRPLPDMQAIATRFFCAEEAAELMSLPAEQRAHAFFLCWTRKEAYIKAIGDGLSAPLDGFAVSLRPGEPARLIHLAHDSKAAAAWTLHDLEPAPEYAAALTYRDGPRPLHVLPAVDPVELLG